MTADRPHVYQPRVLTAKNLPRLEQPRNRGGWVNTDPWAVTSTENRPCDVCGGSRNLNPIHVDPSPRPNLARAQAAIAAYEVPA